MAKVIRMTGLVTVCLGLLLLAAPSAYADKGGVPNRDPVPACSNSHGQAPVKNPHCYPPREDSTTTTSSHNQSFTTTPTRADSGPTVGMALAGLIALSGAALLFRRRRAKSLAL